jgi:OOP family OmpA-OmpF porin
MEVSRRWTIAAVAVILIAIVLWYLTRGEEAKPPAESKVAAQPTAPKAEPKPEPPAPVKPAVEEPLAATVLFDYDRSVIRPGDASKLDDFAARLKGRVFDRLVVEGYADRIGSDAYNLSLSRQRAEAVRGYLAGKGVDGGRFRAEARGEASPVSGSACENMGAANRRNRKLIECLQPDRRVELRLVAKP